MNNIFLNIAIPIYLILIIIYNIYIERLVIYFRVYPIKEVENYVAGFARKSSIMSNP